MKIIPHFAITGIAASAMLAAPVCADNGAACDLPGDPGRDAPIVGMYSATGSSGPVTYMPNTILGGEHEIVQPPANWIDKIYRI